MGIAERREREKERRKNDILDAAEKVFFSEGIDNATMDDVAAEAELSKGTLYLYFKSKQELYLGINIRGLRILKNALLEELDSSGTGMETLKRLSYAYREFSRVHPDYFDALLYFQKIESESGFEIELSNKVRQTGEEVLGIIEKAIEQGRKDRTIRCPHNSQKLSFLLWGQITGVIQMIARLKKSPNNVLPFEPDELFQDYMTMLHNGLTFSQGG